MQAARWQVIRLSLSIAALVAFRQVPAACTRVQGGPGDRTASYTEVDGSADRGAIPTADSDNVTLLCRPRPANRPCSATTSSTSTSTSTTTSSTTSTTSSTTSTTAVSSTTSSTTTTVTSTTASPTSSTTTT